jgi:hypothetical protein
MSPEARCPQCAFVSSQLGHPTPCLLHVRLEDGVDSDEAEVYDEPYAFGTLRLTVDKPGPFTLREYVRLQLLRTRLQAEPSELDAPAPAGSLSAR